MCKEGSCSIPQPIKTYLTLKVTSPLPIGIDTSDRQLQSHTNPHNMLILKVTSPLDEMCVNPSNRQLQYHNSNQNSTTTQPIITSTLIMTNPLPIGIDAMCVNPSSRQLPSISTRQLPRLFSKSTKYCTAPAFCNDKIKRKNQFSIIITIQNFNIIFSAVRTGLYLAKVIKQLNIIQFVVCALSASQFYYVFHIMRKFRFLHYLKLSLLPNS